MNVYRSRIYGAYVHGRQNILATDHRSGLAPRKHYLRKLIQKHFPKDRAASVLDLGCGYGATLYFAREAGYNNLKGIDGSTEQVEAAQQLGLNCVEHGDLLEALSNARSNSVDVLITFDVLEHFTRDELIPIVDEIYRVLKQGGRWIIHVPNGESPFGGRILYGDFTHELAFTRISIGQLTYSSGFSAVTTYEDSPVVHGAKSLLRYVLWRLIRLFLLAWMAVETGEVDRSSIFSQNFLAVAIK